MPGCAAGYQRYSARGAIVSPRKPELIAAFPFTADASPITLTAKARKIPGWTVDQYGLCGVLPQSPVTSTEPVETVTLVPMGTARLRISAFSVLTY